MRRTFPHRVAGLWVLLGLQPLGAEDNVLVPLETEASDVRRGLTHLEEGRHREGIEVLQAVLSRHARERQRGGYLVRVPQRLPAGAKDLRESLEKAWGLEAEVAAPPGREPADGEEPEAAVRGTAPRGWNPVRRGAIPAARSREDGWLARRFLPVETVAQACLATLPASGLKVYRSLYDDLARRLFTDSLATRDPELLERVVHEFLLTSAGDDAAEVLGDTLFEAGQYARAAHWWRVILRDSRDSDLPPARVRGKLLHALRAIGLEKEYVLERERLRGEAAPPEAPTGIEKTAPLFLAEDRARSERASRWGGELEAARPPAIPLAFETGERGAARGAPVAGPAAGELRLSWDSWIWSRRGVETFDVRPSPRDFLWRGGGISEAYPHLPFLPLIDGESIYVSGVFSLYRLDGRLGGGAVTFEYPKPTTDHLLQHYKERAESDSALYTTTIWRKRLEEARGLDALPDEILITQYIADRVDPSRFMNYSITEEIPIRSLIAFDAGTGRLLWRSDAVGGASPPAPPPREDRPLDARRLEPKADLDEEDEEEVFPGMPGRAGAFPVDTGAAAWGRGFSFTSPAVVRRGLVVAGGWMQRGYINSGLRALDLETGALVWETQLSGAQVEPTMFGEMAREPFAGAIAEEGGIVYYATQMGVVAAVELETGRIRWLTSYDTIELTASFSPRAELRRLSWGLNPLLLLGHVLVVAPRDSEFLLGVDTGLGPEGMPGGGRILWQFWNPGMHAMAELRDLLGYHQGRLFFTGPGPQVNGQGVVAALDLRPLSAAGELPADPGGGDEARVPSPQLLGPLRTRGPLPGPGALCTIGIVLADAKGLRWVDFDLTEERDLGSSPYRSSEMGSYPGRVQFADGSILLTSRHLISAYGPAFPREAR